MRLTIEEKSWLLYDWANSVYATIMLAAIFPVYFTSQAAAAGYDGDFWWSIGTACGTALAAILSPFLGAIADYQGFKKRLFGLFLVLGLAFTAFCAFTADWQGMLIGYIISHLGYSASVMIYDSFLPDITSIKRMDYLSSLGFALGYIGGSTIPFIAAVCLINFGEAWGIDGILAVRISLIIAVFWWGIFSIPLIINCHQKNGYQVSGGRLLQKALLSLKSTILILIKNKAILYFMIAYFFYIDGVNTVISMSTAYGTTLGLEATQMILALLITQIIAFPAAIFFGRLAGKFGSLRLIGLAIGIYFIICISGFIMGFGIEEQFLSIAQATTVFWCLAILVGLVQGGIQAISRSHFGKMIPIGKAGEYFGIFDIFGKFAAILGPALYALVRGLSGRGSYAILSILILFALGGIFLYIAGKHAKTMA